jgi:spoIIIJ-associated protein
MRSIESEGESIDDAIGNALRLLGTDRDRVEIEILSDATRGVFGFGGKKARVRATVRAPLSAAFDDEPPRPASPVPRGTGSGAACASSSDAPQPRRTERPEPVASERPAPVSLEAQEKAKQILQQLLSHLGVVCCVEGRSDAASGATVLDIVGDSGGLVIGRRGQTLDAIEYLVNRMVGRQEESSPGRLVVDAERYRERRREYLEDLARRLADKVRQTGRPVTLNPMSPRDRRTVHLVLRDGAGVVTRSQGEGFFRKVIVLPAGGGSRRARPGREAD